jgi:hypothetical protein
MKSTIILAFEQNFFMDADFILVEHTIHSMFMFELPAT